jgi:hypothetical protein
LSKEERMKADEEMHGDVGSQLETIAEVEVG